jgi:hypothetical protein
VRRAQEEKNVKAYEERNVEGARRRQRPIFSSPSVAGWEEFS